MCSELNTAFVLDCSERFSETVLSSNRKSQYCDCSCLYYLQGTLTVRNLGSGVLATAVEQASFLIGSKVSDFTTKIYRCRA